MSGGKFPAFAALRDEFSEALVDRGTLKKMYAQMLSEGRKAGSECIPRIEARHRLSR